MLDQTTIDVIEELIEALAGYDPGHAAVVVGKALLSRQEVMKPQVLPARFKRKSCNTCTGAIFWAWRPDKKMNTLNGAVQWVPMIPEPLEATGMVIDAMCLDFSHAATYLHDAPRITSYSPGATQWLPHRLFCHNAERPTDPAVAALWDKTVGKDIEETGEAITGLLTLLEEEE